MRKKRRWARRRRAGRPHGHKDPNAADRRQAPPEVVSPPLAESVLQKGRSDWISRYPSTINPLKYNDLRDHDAMESALPNGSAERRGLAGPAAATRPAGRTPIPFPAARERMRALQSID